MARVQTATQTGVGSTRWIKLNQLCTPFNVGVQVGLGGTTATYQVEGTLDEVDVTTGTTAPGGSFVAPVSLPIGSTASADGLVGLSIPVSAVRVTITAGAGTVAVRVLQAGVT